MFLFLILSRTDKFAIFRNSPIIYLLTPSLMQSLDILYIVLSVCLIFISLPLTMILWRTYKMMDRVESILGFMERLVGYAKEIESIPMKVVERMMK